MTNQEAISRIKDHISVHKIGEYPHIHIAEALNMAISALESQSAWIPCSERLPDVTDRYEVTWFDKADKTVYSDVEPFFADARQWHYEYKADPSVEQQFVVIAWRKRPEPYQGEGVTWTS